MALVVITNAMAVCAETAERVIVLYAGQHVVFIINEAATAKL